MALVTTDKGTQTPEQMAKAIVQEAVEPLMIELPGTTKMKVETIVRYLNRDKISARGDSWFRKHYDSLTTDALVVLVDAREKAITDYLKKKELSDKDEAFRDLVARGMAVPDAYKQIFS